MASRGRPARRLEPASLRAPGDRAAAADRIGGDLAARRPGRRLGDSELVRLALARLGERDREALALVGWDGLDGRRAAHAAGCSAGAFAVRLHRARARLRAALRELESTEVALDDRALAEADPMEAR